MAIEPVSALKDMGLIRVGKQSVSEYKSIDWWKLSEKERAVILICEGIETNPHFQNMGFLSCLNMFSKIAKIQ